MTIFSDYVQAGTIKILVLLFMTAEVIDIDKRLLFIGISFLINILTLLVSFRMLSQFFCKAIVF